MYIIERYLSVIYLILNFYHNIFKSESIPISRNRNILLSIPIFIVIFSKAKHAAYAALTRFGHFQYSRIETSSYPIHSIFPRLPRVRFGSQSVCSTHGEEGTGSRESFAFRVEGILARPEEDPICRSYALLGSVYVVNTRDSVSRGNSTRKIPHARDAAIA